MRCGTSTQKVVRKAIFDLLRTKAREQTFVEFSKNMVNGDIAEELKAEVSKIFPSVLVDIRKSKVLVLPDSKAATAAT